MQRLIQLSLKPSKADPCVYVKGSLDSPEGLLIVGLGYYAMSRGQSKWFGALGLLSCLGLIVLALLPKKCLVCTGPVQRAFCQRCGAPGAK